MFYCFCVWLDSSCFTSISGHRRHVCTVRINTETVLSRRVRLKCDGTGAETRFGLSAKRTSPFKSAGASVQSTTGSRVVRISCSNAGYTVFRGSVKSTGYPLHSPVSPSLPLLWVTVCHQVSTGLYQLSQQISRNSQGNLFNKVSALLAQSVFRNVQPYVRITSEILCWC